MHMLGILYVAMEHISTGIARFKDIAKHAAYRNGKGAGRFPVKKRDDVAETVPVYRVRVGQVGPLRQADVQQVQPEGVVGTAGRCRGIYSSTQNSGALCWALFFCPMTSGFMFAGAAGSIGGMPVMLRKPKI